MIYWLIHLTSRHSHNIAYRQTIPKAWYTIDSCIHVLYSNIISVTKIIFNIYVNKCHNDWYIMMMMIKGVFFTFFFARTLISFHLNNHRRRFWWLLYQLCCKTISSEYVDDYFEICLGTHAIFPLSVYYMTLDRSIMAISKT